MNIIKQSFEIITEVNRERILKNLERIGRTAYQSQDKITADSASRFVEMLIKRGHESVIEHESITIKVITNRAIANEITRHRIGSYTQESTRYCNYKTGLTFIKNNFTEGFNNLLKQCEDAYIWAIEHDFKPEWIRDILPLALKTELVVTYNLRQWRHFFDLRCDARAHPMMRKLACDIRNKFHELLPEVF